MSRCIRKGTLADAETIAQYNIKMAWETEDITLDGDTVRLGVTALLKDAGKGSYYVVEVAGKVVACLMVTFEWSDWRNAQLWWIQSVYVHGEHRRQGHFKAMYEHVKACALAQKAKGLRLYVDQGNAAAMNTYKSLGMVSHYLVFEDKDLQ